MIPLESWIGFLHEYGLWIVALASIVEGPIVTVISALLARQGAFDLAPLYGILVLGDLIGDYGHYALGRWGFEKMSPRWRSRLGLNPERVAALTSGFERKGGRLLAFGKLTHSAGAAFLVAAGIARMPTAPFLLYNFLATLPKTAAFMALGWYAGDAYAKIDLWLERGALVMLGLIAGGLAIWYVRRRRCRRV